jgi:hypothetical protein
MTEALPEDGASPRLRLVEAVLIVAEVAGELASSQDVLTHRQGMLKRAATRLADAMRDWPDCPEAWNEIAPFVVNSRWERVTIPEMLLVGDPPDPRRIARLLLRSLDWDLPFVAP